MNKTTDKTLLAARQIVRLAAEAKRAAGVADAEDCMDVATFEDGKALAFERALEELCVAHGLSAEAVRKEFG